jgi:hypothetical protein
MTGFQKCPICNGTGKKYNTVFSGNPWFDIAFNLPSIYKDENGNIKSTADLPCVVCKGKMIISSETGLPPT